MTEQEEFELIKQTMKLYEDEKNKNPDYLSFDKTMIQTFARRIVGQIKEQMKLNNEQCEMLLNAIYGGTHEIN